VEPSEFKERFSRQVLLSSVGEAGQKKWAESSVTLFGEGPAFEAALLALATSGLTTLRLQTSPDFDLVGWKNRFPEVQLSLHDSARVLSASTACLILSDKADWRRQINRSLRVQPQPAFFGWNAGSGFGLFFSTYQAPGEPCFECFEVLNPKAFNAGSLEAQKLLGALAASELLQWILKGESPLENKVWIASLDEGLSFHHPVSASEKCPAYLIAAGAKVTP
jgi:molybdopterin/thiamine biosynthesis adenylyltransferase